MYLYELLTRSYHRSTFRVIHLLTFYLKQGVFVIFDEHNVFTYYYCRANVPVKNTASAVGYNIGAATGMDVDVEYKPQDSFADSEDIVVLYILLFLLLSLLAYVYLM